MNTIKTTAAYIGTLSVGILVGATLPSFRPLTSGVLNTLPPLRQATFSPGGIKQIEESVGTSSLKPALKPLLKSGSLSGDRGIYIQLVSVSNAQFKLLQATRQTSEIPAKN